MTLSSLRADHYRIPLPVALSDSTHGEITGRQGEALSFICYTLKLWVTQSLTN